MQTMKQRLIVNAVKVVKKINLQLLKRIKAFVLLEVYKNHNRADRYIALKREQIRNIEAGSKRVSKTGKAELIRQSRQD